jgi:hypothetical protein
MRMHEVVLDCEVFRSSQLPTACSELELCRAVSHHATVLDSFSAEESTVSSWGS